MKRRLKYLSALMILLCFTVSLASGEVFVSRNKPDGWDSRDLLRVTVAEFPYNDAFLLECGGQSMLIDGGTKKYRQRLMDFLKSKDLTHLTYIFNSHPHDDHLQGTYLDVKLEGLTADEFISPFPEDYRNDIQKKAVTVLKAAGIPYRQIMPEDTVTIGTAEMTVYQWPDGNDPNERSAFCRLVYGDAVMVFGADVTGGGQRWLAKHYGADVLKADILKVPHHALVTMVPEFLETVDPDLAIITSTVTKTKKTNNQLTKAGVPYLHHSKGTIILESDGKDWYVTQTEGLI